MFYFLPKTWTSCIISLINEFNLNDIRLTIFTFSFVWRNWNSCNCFRYLILRNSSHSNFCSDTHVKYDSQDFEGIVWSFYNSYISFCCPEMFVFEVIDNIIPPKKWDSGETFRLVVNNGYQDKLQFGYFFQVLHLQVQVWQSNQCNYVLLA